MWIYAIHKLKSFFISIIIYISVRLFRDNVTLSTLIVMNILQNKGFIFDALWPQDWNDFQKYNIKFVSHVGVWKI